MDKENKESFEDVYTVTSLLHKLGISAQVDILKKLNALGKQRLSPHYEIIVIQSA